MAGKVPRMRVPVSRQIIGTRDIRLEPAVDTSTAQTLVSIFNALAGQTSAGQRIVTYIATGVEGSDFRVPIGATLGSAAYEVGFFGIAGAVNVPVCDFPTGPGDRTASSFRVLTAAPLTVGDVLKFELVET